MTDCARGKIRNPATGRCVSIDGAIGKRIMSRKSRKPPSRKADCAAGKIRNPATGRCVNGDGDIGKK